MFRILLVFVYILAKYGPDPTRSKLFHEGFSINCFGEIFVEKNYRKTFINHLRSCRIGTILCQSADKYQENPTQTTRVSTNCWGRPKKSKIRCINFSPKMGTHISQGTHIPIRHSARGALAGCAEQLELGWRGGPESGG